MSAAGSRLALMIIDERDKKSATAATTQLAKKPANAANALPAGALDSALERAQARLALSAFDPGRRCCPSARWAVPRQSRCGRSTTASTARSHGAAARRDHAGGRGRTADAIASPPMRDPRLVEIDFLMDLETRDTLTVRTTGIADTTYAKLGSYQTTYGIDPVRFRDLVVGLLIDAAIGGSLARGQSEDILMSALEHERTWLVARLISGQPIDVYLNHKGRIRLWTLRDDLLRDPDLEPMGLRSKAAWERDLFLRLRWASAEAPLAIVFIDLDDFGKVNKERGATVGDDVLRATFAIARNLVGPRGQVYRYGGEEVGVLLPNTTLEAARTLAEELRAMIEADVHRRAPELGRTQTASLGVAAFEATVEPRAAVDRVDALMREAKRAGKNRVIAAAAAAG
jgi:diguanylate cyclase (GGDEF)-like protein